MVDSSRWWHVEIPQFTRQQTEILKGIGILLIVLHNVFHNMTPYIGQNEFSFHPQVFERFYQTIVNNPLELLRALFSYLGHYGVQLFVFFSAYGLTRKYRGENLVVADFFKRRVGKIYFSFLLCVVVYIALGLLKEWMIPGEKVLYWDSLLWKVLLISNFLPNQAMMPVGPWWFIPFIFQVYLLYPVLLWLFRKYGAVSLLLVSLTSVAARVFLNPWLMQHGLNMNFMVFGHLPVLCLGMYLGAAEKVRFRGAILLLALIVFIGGNFSFYLWVVEDLAVTVLMLAVAIHLFNSRLKLEWATAVLLFYGGLSFHLFMVNGFLRTPFHQLAERYDLWWMDNLAALASLGFSTLFALGLRAIDQRLRGLLVKVQPALDRAR